MSKVIVIETTNDLLSRIEETKTARKGSMSEYTEAQKIDLIIKNQEIIMESLLVLLWEIPDDEYR